ncbi:MAG TPA: C25 family peptidase propeptide domain-containing protein, partial [Bacteroidota bacterium]|nr:C25 family peptidase propeptide domain-containing protein [Bacteroidota bacterium]
MLPHRGIYFIIACIAWGLTGRSSAVSLPAAGRTAGGDIRVLSSDGSSTVVEFVPSYLPAAKQNIRSGEFLRMDFGNSESPDRLIPGTPDLPVRSIPLRLGSLSNTVEILEASYTDTVNITPPPVPGVMDVDGMPEPSYVPDAAAYGRAGFVPANPVSLENVGESRGAVFGNLVVTPVLFDAASRTLRKYTRIVVRVRATGSLAGSGPADRLTGGIGVNDRLGVAVAPARRPASRIRRAGGGPASSVLGEGPWLKLSISEGGMVRLTGQYLRDAGVPSGVDPRTIRVFGNGGGELPVDPLAAVADDLTEVSRLVNDAGTPGSLDGADEVIFYAEASRGWTYVPATRKMSHFVNRY